MVLSRMIATPESATVPGFFFGGMEVRMGCRCSDRARQIRAAGAAALRGDLAASRDNLAAAGRSLAGDARSGALAAEARRLAAARLASLRRR